MKKVMWMRVLALFLTVLLSVHSIPTLANVSDGGTDSNIKNLEVMVYQNGTEIKEGEKLQADQPLELKLSFGVPVAGDWIINNEEIPETGYIKHGDRVEFPIPYDFKVDESGSCELKYGDIKVGTLLLENDESDQAKVSVIFDGDESIFSEETDDPYFGVECGFECKLTYNKSDDVDHSGDHNIVILNKEFILSVPTPDIKIEGTKSGKKNGQYIDWVVHTTALQGANEASYEGFTFYDDLRKVGSYVDGSFAIGKTEVKADANLVLPDADHIKNNELFYQFTGEETGDVYIFYTTKIDDDLYLKNGIHNITNNAVIKQEDQDLVEMSGTVPFTQEWIKKHENSDRTNGDVTWTVEANLSQEELRNAKIKDLIADHRLDFVKAVTYIYDSEQEKYKEIKTYDSQPDDGIYEYGDVNHKIKLEITAKVKEKTDIKHHTFKVYNTATLMFDGCPGIPSNTVSSTFGKNPITKRCTSYDLSSRKINWEIGVSKSDKIDNLYVYDLLVYGKDVLIGGDYILVDETGEVVAQNSAMKDCIDRELVALNQQYVRGSFKTDDNLKIDVYTVKRNDQEKTAVADLIVVRDSDGSGFSVAEGRKVFSFQSKVMNPEVYYGNKVWTKEETFKNCAYLYENDEFVNKGTASKDISSNMLKKDVLPVSDAQKDLTIADHVNGSSANQSNGFNYIDKTAVFRIHVNANGLVIPAEEMEASNSLVLTEQLPDGWSFEKFEDESDFIVYHGQGVSGSTIVTAKGNPIENTDDIFSVTVTDSNKAVFHFHKLDGPYLILVKAKLDADTEKEYFGDNKQVFDTNRVYLSDGNNKEYCTDESKVMIKSDVFTKDNLAETGVLTWNITYTPYDRQDSYSWNKITDTLGKGIELRTNSNGTLNFSDGNFIITKLSLTVDGSLEELEQLKNVEDYIKYNNATRELEFTIPDSKYAYRFTYKTDLTGEPNQTIQNTAILEGGSEQVIDAKKEYTISQADSSVVMNRAGWIKITKRDNKGAILDNVEFTLFDEAGQVEIRKGLTSNGTLYFRGLTTGRYILKETKTLAGYLPNNNVYEVIVEKIGNTITTSIEGESYNYFTVINVKADTVGSLSVKKEVEGTGADLDQQFEFYIKASDLNGDYSIVDSLRPEEKTLNFENGSATILLQHGQTITISGIPAGTSYTVTESDDTMDGYIVNQKEFTGSISANQTEEIVFVNTKEKKDESKPTDTPLPEETPTPETGVTPTPSPEETPMPEIGGTPTPEAGVTPAPGVEVTPIPETGATSVPEITNRPLKPQINDEVLDHSPKTEDSYQGNLFFLYLFTASGAMMLLLASKLRKVKKN